jgi:carbonic anhydrase
MMRLHFAEEHMISGEQAMHRLRLSNERFLQGTARFSRIRKGIPADFARGQHPYATILSCSDSRVPPELIFDAGFGELFVVRVAGNVFAPEVSGSIQYADTCLNTPLLVVLGHEDCGAVQAAVEARLHGVQPPSRIRVLVDDIIPGLACLNTQLPPRELLSRAVEANVRWTMRQILEAPEGQACLSEGRMQLVGAIYDIESGHVRFLT